MWCIIFKISYKLINGKPVFHNFLKRLMPDTSHFHTTFPFSMKVLDWKTSNLKIAQLHLPRKQISKLFSISSQTIFF